MLNGHNALNKYNHCINSCGGVWMAKYLRHSKLVLIYTFHLGKDIHGNIAMYLDLPALTYSAKTAE